MIPPDPIRQEVFALAHTIVVKVGTNVLTDAAGRLDTDRVAALAGQLHRLRDGGRRVVLVSSGAIGAGVGRLGLKQRPTSLPELQACAAVGQIELMRAYQHALDPHGVRTAQILLTAGDFDSRGRYLNVRHTIFGLWRWGCLPVINENDTVSTAEIRFGDNDHLAAMVANLLQAPLLVLLTNVSGLYSADPRTDPTAELLTTVPAIDTAVTDFAGVSKSPLGTGGMRSKLRAARLVTSAGEAVIMADGALPDVLDRLRAAEPIGTLFLPHGGFVSARKRWLGYTARPRGQLITDAGARKAVVEGGKSLLPIGVVRVIGSFGKGDVVAVADEAGDEYARGLCNYSSAHAGQICRMRSEQVANLFGRGHYPELIHRDNLVILDVGGTAG